KNSFMKTMMSHNGVLRAALTAFAVFLAFNPSNLLANLVIGPPPVQNVLLVTTENNAEAALPSVLRCAGANVTILRLGGVCTNPLQAALTAAGLTLAQFDQVWDVRWPTVGCTALSCCAATPGSDENLYANYMAGGGS